VTDGPRRKFGFDRRTLAVVALVVVTVTPILAAGIEAATQSWFPAGDWGMLELRTLDVGGTETPLLGPYSRYAWNHPGPLLFWVFALPYRLTGSNPTGLLLAASAVNAASVVGLLVFAYRRGRIVLLIATAVATSLLLLNLGPDLLRDPWNPWVTVLPFGLLVMLAWSATEGDRIALPLAAFVGSFLIQAHVGFMALVVALGAWAIIVVWRRKLPMRPLAWAGAVALACWLPVLFDLAFGRQNLVEMVQHFAGSDEEPAGFGTAVGIAARELGIGQPWLGADEPPNPVGGGLMTRSAVALLLPLLAFAAAFAFAWVRQRFEAVRFQATVAVAGLVGVVSVARVTDDVFNYLVRWWWVIAALGWVSAFWSTWSAWLVERPTGDLLAKRARTTVAVVGSLSVLWFSVGTVRDIEAAPMPADDWHPALLAVTDDALAGIPHDRPVLVENTGPLSGWAFDALTTRMVADGIDVVVPDEGINRNKFGDHRIVGDEAPGTAVWIVTGTPIESFRTDPDFEEIAAYDPLTPEERARYLALEAALILQLRAAGMHDVVFALEQGLSLYPAKDNPAIDQQLLKDVDDLRARRQPLAVFLGPTDQPAPVAG
jgi:hypothetical protein